MKMLWALTIVGVISGTAVSPAKRGGGRHARRDELERRQ